MRFFNTPYTFFKLQIPSPMIGIRRLPTIGRLKLVPYDMNFRLGLPWTQKSYDSIWVVVDQLTKSTHFIPVKSTYLEEDYARIFIDEIV